MNFGRKGKIIMDEDDVLIVCASLTAAVANMIFYSILFVKFIMPLTFLYGNLSFPFLLVEIFMRPLFMS